MTASEPTSWTRGERWALGAFVVAAIASLAHFAHPFYDAVNDAALYVLTARSLISGEGYAYLGTSFVVRPPGFSLLLAPWLAAFGNDFRVLNLVIELWSIACLAFVFVLYRPRLGATLALALCAAIWIHPVWQRFSTQLMSDVPGATLLFACLALERWDARRPSRARGLALAACLAAAIYVRTTHFVLLPAIACARLATRWLRRARPPAASVEPEPLPSVLRLAWILGLPLLAYAPWAVRNELVAPSLASDQLFVHSYSTALWHADAADPSSPRVPLGDVAARVPQRLHEMAQLVGARLREGVEGTTPLVVGAIALAAVLAVLALRRAPAEFLALGLVLALSIYPYEFQPRHVLPIALLALGACFDLARSGLRRLVGERWSGPLLAAALAWPALSEFDAENGRAGLERQHVARSEVSAFLVEHYPPEAALAAPLGWHLAVLAERRIYSMQILCNRTSFAASLDLIRRHKVEAVVVSTDSYMGSRYMQEFIRRRYPLVATVGDNRIYGTTPGATPDPAPPRATPEGRRSRFRR